MMTFDTVQSLFLLAMAGVVGYLIGIGHAGYIMARDGYRIEAGHVRPIEQSNEQVEQGE